MSEPGKLTEKERLAKLRKWENAPSPNPRYKGASPADMARALFRKKKE